MKVPRPFEYFSEKDHKGVTFMPFLSGLSSHLNHIFFHDWEILNEGTRFVLF